MDLKKLFENPRSLMTICYLKPPEGQSILKLPVTNKQSVELYLFAGLHWEKDTTLAPILNEIKETKEYPEDITHLQKYCHNMHIGNDLRKDPLELTRISDNYIIDEIHIIPECIYFNDTIQTIKQKIFLTIERFDSKGNEIYPMEPNSQYLFIHTPTNILDSQLFLHNLYFSLMEYNLGTGYEFTWEQCFQGFMNSGIEIPTLSIYDTIINSKLLQSTVSLNELLENETLCKELVPFLQEKSTHCYLGTTLHYDPANPYQCNPNLLQIDDYTINAGFSDTLLQSIRHCQTIYLCYANDFNSTNEVFQRYWPKYSELSSEEIEEKYDLISQLLSYSAIDYYLHEKIESPKFHQRTYVESIQLQYRIMNQLKRKTPISINHLDLFKTFQAISVNKHILFVSSKLRTMKERIYKLYSKSKYESAPYLSKLEFKQYQKISKQVNGILLVAQIGNINYQRGHIRKNLLHNVEIHSQQGQILLIPKHKVQLLSDSSKITTMFQPEDKVQYQYSKNILIFIYETGIVECRMELNAEYDRKESWSLILDEFVTNYLTSLRLGPMIKEQFTKSFHNSIYQQRTLQPYPLTLYRSPQQLVHQKLKSINYYQTFQLSHKINKVSFTKFLELFYFAITVKEPHLTPGTRVLVFEMGQSKSITGKIIRRYSPRRTKKIIYDVKPDNSSEILEALERYQLIVNKDRQSAFLEVTYKRVNNYQRIRALQEEIEDYIFKNNISRENEIDDSQRLYFKTKYSYNMNKINGMLRSTLEKQSSIRRQEASNGLQMTINLKSKQIGKLRYEYKVMYENVTDSYLLSQVYQFLYSVFRLYDQFITNPNETAEVLETRYNIYLTYNKEAGIFEWDKDLTSTIQQYHRGEDEDEEDNANQQALIEEMNQQTEMVLSADLRNLMTDFMDSSDEDDSEESLPPQSEIIQQIRETERNEQNIGDFLNKLHYRHKEELVETTDGRIRSPNILGKLYQLDELLFKSRYKKNKTYTQICQPTDRHPIGLTTREKEHMDQLDLDNPENGPGIGLGDEQSKWCDRHSSYDDLANCKGIKWGSNKNPAYHNWFICPLYWCTQCNRSFKTRPVDNICPVCQTTIKDKITNPSKQFKLAPGELAWPGFVANYEEGLPCCFAPSRRKTMIENIRKLYNKTKDEVYFVYNQKDHRPLDPKRIISKNGKFGKLPKFLQSLVYTETPRKTTFLKKRYTLR